MQSGGCVTDKCLILLKRQQESKRENRNKINNKIVLTPTGVSMIYRKRKTKCCSILQHSNLSWLCCDVAESFFCFSLSLSTFSYLPKCCCCCTLESCSQVFLTVGVLTACLGIQNHRSYNTTYKLGGRDRERLLKSEKDYLFTYLFILNVVFWALCFLSFVLFILCNSLIVYWWTIKIYLTD